MNIGSILQEQEVISIRNFMRNLSKITSKPKSKIYTLVKNGKKVGTYVPEKYEKEVYGHRFMGVSDKKPKYTSFFDNYEKIASTGGDPNLSQKIDQILYGTEAADR